MQEIYRKIKVLEHRIEQLAMAIVGTPRSNPTATTAPTVNDDRTRGYSPLSQWLNETTDTAYICCDNTEGAAVWKQTTP